MSLYLVRFAELGLKSERVRRRFLQSFLRDIENRLTSAGIDHIIERERGRIFIDTSMDDETEEVLKRIPGIQSFSPVESCSSDWDQLMEKLSEVGRRVITSGMSYGLKVRRSGSNAYTSQDVAIEGGGAVVSHLREGENRVDLRDPDIWVEVEVRRGRAYIFTRRIPGIGGMPSDTQGKSILYLPPISDVQEDDRRISRAVLAKIILERRGTRVIPATLAGHEREWGTYLRSAGLEMDQDPFILDDGPLKDSLISAVNKIGAKVVAYPVDIDGIQGLPVVHEDGFPAAVLYPTASLDDDEVSSWLHRLMG